MSRQDQTPAYPEEYGDHLVAGLSALADAVLGLCFIATIIAAFVSVVALAWPLFAL